ncbi:hypothetical protein [Microbacterium sp. NFH-22A-Y]|uniref:hypothetical protein n=1 Tax=Microbacterium sp. NFH-22A-Y TaxID=2744448 RepID=UPI001F44269E|nr:hypothetical protein [Microbacterium sp. NFH-22A-Y]
MGGRITFTPPRRSVCDRPAGCQGRPAPEPYPRGTIWTCDECGSEWVVVEGAQYNEAYSAWRRLTDRNRDGSDR